MSIAERMMSRRSLSSPRVSSPRAGVLCRALTVALLFTTPMGLQAKIDAVQRLGEAEAELDTRLLQTEYRKETIPGGGAADAAARGADGFMWTAWHEVEEEDY